MNKIYPVSIKVVSQKGPCDLGHEIGDEFECSGVTPNGLCMWAFNTIFSQISTLMFGGEYFWENNKDTVKVACSNVENQLVFEIKRIRPEK